MTEKATDDELEDIITNMTFEMKKAAETLDFEKAAKIRDNITELRKKMNIA